MPSAESFPQRFDVVYHINALHYILETGNASSLSLGTMVYTDSQFSFYPALWHGLGSLSMTATGDDVFVATNAVLYVSCAILWPLSIVVLTGSIVGFRPLPLATAGVGSAAFSSFPFALINFGPLLPNIISMALLPSAIALLASIIGITRGIRTNTFQKTILLLAMIGGLGVAQPNSLATLLVLSLIMVLASQGRKIRVAFSASAGNIRGTRTTLHRYYRKLLLRCGIIAISVLIFVGAWYALQTGYDNPNNKSLFTAVGEGVLLAPSGRGEIPWVFTTGALIGLIIAFWHRRYMWVALAHIAVVLLYVYAAGVKDIPFRSWLVGPWYEDTYRLAGLLPVFAVVLTALLVTSVVDVLMPETLLPVHVLKWRPAVEILLVFVLCFSYINTTQNVPFRFMDKYLKDTFAWDGEPFVLSQDEYDLLRQLNQYVPEDAVIGVNPWTGAGLAYSLSDRQVTSRHIYTNLSPDEELVAQELDNPGESVEACNAAERSDISYVLDFGDDFVIPNNPDAEQFPAFTNIEDTPTDPYDEVARVGDKVLYEVIC